jgi:polar amino acid transport system substrate-binding protein
MRLTKLLLGVSLLFLVVGARAFATDVTVLGNESMPWNGIVDGKESGIMVDILNEATKNGAPKFIFKLGLPWVRAQQMVHEQNDQPTVIIPLTRTLEREKNYK